MRIILDNIVFSLQDVGGISTYWYELILRLLRDEHDIEFIERYNRNLLRKELQINSKRILNTGVNKLLFDRFLNIQLQFVKEKFVFHSSYNRVTSNRSAIQISTIHDFVHEKFYKGARRFIHAYQKGKAIRSSNYLIAISESTKNDLLNYYPHIPNEKIRVIYNGVSDEFYQLKSAAVDYNSFKKERQYLLFVGSRAHYKNFHFCVALLKEITDFELYIVGPALTNSENDMLQKLLPGRWKLFTKISNRELNILYNNAYALLYPSLYEGFGIPLLEAMKAGLPFIALNRSSIPEVAGNAGILLDELDLESFKKAVYSIESKHVELIQEGLLQAQKFSWEKCYQETVATYKEQYLL